MAEITSFLICDSIGNMPAPVPGQSVPALIAPQLVIRPEFVPGNFSFGIAVGVSGIDTTKELEIRVTIEDPDEKTVFDSGMSKFPKGEPDTLPKDQQGFMLTMDIRNLAISKNGLYNLRIYINGEVVGSKSIPVYKRK